VARALIVANTRGKASRISDARFTAGPDAALPAEERSKRGERFAARAMELLLGGYEAGEIGTQPTVAWIEADHGFDTLRRQTDFVELL
jgi:hypothetical protein